MASFNKVILAGNLTRDPELRYTPKGTAVAKIGLAVNRKWKTDTGETKEEVTFVDVDAFGRQAEVLAQYLRKGRSVLVEGRLKLDQWEDKNTQKKMSRLGVILESFSFLGDGGGGGGRGGDEMGSSPAPRSSSHSAPPAADGPEPEDDDVPF